MSTGDTWNDAGALARLSNKGSGSQDSMISMNSGFSEDSMEYLSAEERACLMYLEQTIEALEVQEDSGISNDEPDSGHPPEKMGLNKVKDILRLNLESGKLRRSENLPTLPGGLLIKQESVYITLIEENRAQHYLPNQTCEPNFPTASEVSSEELRASLNLKSQPKLLVTDSVTGRNVPLCADTNGLGSPLIDNAPNIITGVTPEIDLGLIPPPSDFMDDPAPDPEPEPEPDPVPEPEPDPDPYPEAENIKTSPQFSNSRPVSVDLTQLYQRAVEKRPPFSPPVNKKPTNKLLTETRQSRSLPALESLIPVSRRPEAAEPRSPPIVAPKPKRSSLNLPHHSQTEELNSHVGNGNHQLLDHERIHLQALQKLGLLKGSVTESGPAPNHKLSPQTRKSWAAPPSPSSLPVPSPSNLTSSHPSISSGSPNFLSNASAIPPVPSTFSDRARFLVSGREQPPVNNIPGRSLYTQIKPSPSTPSDLVKELTRVTGAQSGAMEHAGLRLSHPADSERVSVEQCLSHVASPDFRRRASSSSVLLQSRDSRKLPRSQGVSVLICPRDGNGVERREALKKLGLIKD